MIDADASAYGLGAVLTQEHKGLLRVVPYYNTKLAGERLLHHLKGTPAMVKSIQHFHPLFNTEVKLLWVDDRKMLHK